MRRPKYRLSPNEVERIVKEDQDRRRKLRIVQVREQSKANAAIIRNDVQREKKRLLNSFAAEIKEKLDAEKEETLRKLQQKYECTLRTIGEGHREALVHGDGESRAEKLQRQMEEEAAAKERYKQALEQQRKDDSLKEYEKTKHIIARQAALEKEKQRAAEIASLPLPPPDINIELEKAKKRAVPMTDMKAFATTHYHIPDYHVVRAGSQEQLYDAMSQAQDTDLKLTQDLQEKKRSQHERLERARIRGNEALQKEHIKHEYEDMLKELSLLQKQDRRRRKKMLSEIPSQVFIPPERCLEEKGERQRQMEDKFHEICMQQSKAEADRLRKVNLGDKPASRDTQDISDYSVSHDTQDISGPVPSATHDVSLPMSKINPALRDLTNVSQPLETLELKKPETVLKQLMNRIKDQRGGVVVHQKAAPVASVKERPTSEVVEQSVRSKAEWERTLEDTPDHNISGRDHRTMSRGQSAYTTEKECKPDVGLPASSDTERMIENLKRRIDLIEIQKEELAQQIKAQSSFHHFIKNDLEEDKMQKMDEESCTLEEVDIDAFKDSEIERTIKNDRCIKSFPARDGDQNVDHVSSASVWKALPGSSLNFHSGSHLRTETRSDCGLGARREINFGIQQDGHLQRGYGVREMVKFDGGDTGFSSGQLQRFGHPQQLLTDLVRPNMSSFGHVTMTSAHGGNVDQGQMMSSKHGQGDNCWQGMRLLNDNNDLIRKVAEYRERAGEKKAGLDAETAKKVMEYQQMLLQTHEERKRHLADVRADIENRRQELYTSSSYRPTFSTESDQMRQTVIGNLLTNSNRGSQVTTLAGQNMTNDDKVGTSVLDSYHEWMPTQPLVSNRSLATNLSVSNRTTGEISDVQKFTGSSSEQTVTGAKQMEKKTGGEKVRSDDQLDRVRKSLSFDDEELVAASHDSWKDADNSKSSQALADDSRLTSNEEERGSPLLPQGNSEISEKSSTSLTGNAFMNGSAFLAEAREKKMGFESRQKELQNQLMEIQRQKDAIMETYYAGQKALQQQQLTLKSKLATASAIISEDSGGKQRAETRAKLAEIRSQINSDTRSQVKSQEIGVGNIVTGVDHIKQSSAFDVIGLDVCSKSSENLNESKERTSSRQSLRSGGTPGNLSSDSYLAEISFHKIRSADDRSLPASAFQPLVSGSSTLCQIPIHSTIGQQQQSQTWASILSQSSSVQQPLELRQQTVSLIGQREGFIDPSATDYQENHRLGISQEQMSLNVQRTQMPDNSGSNLDKPDGQLPQDTSSPLSTYLALMDHQPHELSTILEVDTPSSNSVMTLTRRLVASSVNGSSHAFSSLSTHSSSSNLPSTNMWSGIRMDVFMDLPYTFPEGKAASQGSAGAVYDLTSNQKKGIVNPDAKSGTNVSSESTAPSDQKHLKAKRSLDFSEHLALDMPAPVQATPHNAPATFHLENDGLKEKNSEDPSTVSHYDSTLEDSSFKISGYSDYLQLEAKDGKSNNISAENVDILDVSVNNCDKAVGGSRNCGEEDEKFHNRVDQTENELIVLQARDFNPDMVEGLRQKSEAVFGEVKEGWSSNENSGLSFGLSSIMSDLEEVSIPTTVGETDNVEVE